MEIEAILKNIDELNNNDDIYEKTINNITINDMPTVPDIINNIKLKFNIEDLNIDFQVIYFKLNNKFYGIKIIPSNNYLKLHIKKFNIYYELLNFIDDI